jgi:isoleucyl-tRNA synthetase
VREVFTKTMELARADKTLGSSLEATINLHVQNPALAAWLSGLNASGNAADELKYLLITSGVTLVDSAEAAADGALASSSVDTGAEVAGLVTVGVHKAAGAKCARCWMYSTQVSTRKHTLCICMTGKSIRNCAFINEFTPYHWY